MVSRRCPNCQKINPADNDTCDNCGAAMDSQAVVITQENPVVLSQRQLPAVHLKRLGASVAVGALALLTEVGIIYLRRRAKEMDSSSLTLRRERLLPQKRTVQIEEEKVAGKRIVTVLSERVIEERRWGRPVRRIVDRLAWRSEETVES